MNHAVRLRFQLLGRLELFFERERAPVRVTSRKARGLLAYLAMAPGHAASREELATLLWGECSDQQARQSLRQSLLLLRKDLRHPGFILSNAEMVQLPKERWTIDAAEFEELTSSGDPDDLARAANLFTGDFAAGFNVGEEGFEEWVAAQRLRMQRAATRLCETFSKQPTLVAHPEAAIGASERLLALDPLREDWQRLVLIIHARYRGKGEALALGEHFSRVLQKELGEALEPPTLDLLARIRADEFVPPYSGPPHDAASPVGAPRNLVPVSNQVPSPARAAQSRGRLEILALLGVLAVLTAAGLGTLHEFQGRPPAASIGERPLSRAPDQAEYWKAPSALSE